MARAALRLAGTIFTMIAVLHFIRYRREIPVRFGDKDIPVGASLPAGVVTLAVAAWMFKESRNA